MKSRKSKKSFYKMRYSVSMAPGTLKETTRFYLFTIHVSDNRPIQTAYAMTKDEIIQQTATSLANFPHLTYQVTARPNGYALYEKYFPGSIIINKNGQLVYCGDAY